MSPVKFSAIQVAWEYDSSILITGVFSGWTASDLVGDASDIARFIYDVYAPPYKLVKKVTLVKIAAL